MSAGDRPDLPPRKCATCGCEVRGWFSTAAEVAQGIVYCRAHSTPLGMWSKEANGGAIEAVESVQGPDTAPEGANGSMDAPSDEDELRQMAEAFRSGAPIMREGPTGCGKTMTVTEFAYATGLPIWKVNPLDGGEA